ncbi:MAG: hypothetical protein VXW87_01370 [Pseudomonadota bacterium]|nr:hypothetical protein [Pseudomonadota bacterium]
MTCANLSSTIDLEFLTPLIQSQLTIEAICKVENGMSILHLMARNLHRVHKLYMGLSFSDLIAKVASKPEDYFDIFQTALNAKNDKGASPAYYIAMSNDKHHISTLLDLSMDIFTHETINLVSNDGPWPGTTFAYFLSASYDDRHILERLLADRPHLLTSETLSTCHSSVGSMSMLYFVCMYNHSILPQLIKHHAKDITREALNNLQAFNSSALWYLAANYPELIIPLINTNADIIDPNTFFKRAHSKKESAYDCLLSTTEGKCVLDTLRAKTSLLSTIEASIKLANETTDDSRLSAKCSITLLFRKRDNGDAAPPTKAPKHEADQIPGRRP